MKGLVYIELLLVILLNWFVINTDIIYGSFNSLGLIPKQTIAIIEVIALIILIRLLAKKFLLKTFRHLFVFIGVFIFLHLVLVLLNRGTIFNWIMGLRFYLTSIPFLMVGYYFALKGTSLRPMMKLLLVLLLLQVPVSILQFLFDVPLVPANAGTPYDLVSGTMGGIASNLLGILLASGITFLYVFSRNSRNKLKYHLTILFLLIPAVLGEMKIVFVYLVLIGIIFFIYYRGFKIRDKIKLIILFSVLLTGFKLLYDIILGYGERRDLFSLSFYTNYESNIKGRLSRLDSFFYAWDTLLSENILTFFTGIGIGNGSMNNFYGSDGYFFNEEAFLHFWFRLIIETGFLGFVSFLFIIFYLLKISFYLYKNPPDDFIQNIAFGFWCILLISFIGGFSFDLFFRVQFTYPFTLIAGYLIMIYHKRFSYKFSIT